MTLADLKERILTSWQNLPPEEKRKVVLILVVIAILVIGYLGYVSTRGGSRQERTPGNASQVSEIKLQSDILEKTQYTESLKKYEELKAEIQALKREMEAANRTAEQREKEKGTLAEVFKAPPPPPPPAPVSPPPSVSPSTNMTGTVPPPPPPPAKPVVEYVGDIGIVSGVKDAKMVSAGANATRTEGVKKKYYLPPSFMEAILLSGLDAPAVGKGEGHPVPCLFRIKTPAILPNKVRANLKGCFVIGEGLGNLASERADIRLVSLSCIDRKGRAVIDQKIKGFVVDGDGKIGLRGRVVSKMGATIARSILAGFIGGLGNVFGQTGYSYQISPQGALYLPDPSKAFSTGISSGIQQAARDIQQFYLELARQTIPVVEILATRNVTLVVSEGLWLELKDYEEYGE